MTGIPGTDYYKDDWLVEFKYFKAKEAERMLALSDPRPEDMEQVLAYAKDTKEKFPYYHVRSYIVYIYMCQQRMEMLGGDSVISFQLLY